jgi:hypothetical protein
MKYSKNSIKRNMYIKKIKKKINCINLLWNLNFLFGFNRFLIFYLEKIVIYLTSSCVIWAFFGMSGTSAKKAQITQERVEYNVFLFDEPPQRFQMAENL